MTASIREYQRIRAIIQGSQAFQRGMEASGLLTKEERSILAKPAGKLLLLDQWAKQLESLGFSSQRVNGLLYEKD